jgi:hypothetical protein
MLVLHRAASDIGREDEPPPVAPDWPSPRTIVMAAAALGAAAMLAVPLSALGLSMETQRIAPFTVLFTMYGAFVVMRGALRSNSSGTAVSWCVAGGLFAGACNAVASFLVLMTVHSGLEGLLGGIGMALLGFWLFLAVGGAPGVIVGVSFVPLVAGGRGIEGAPSRRDLPVVALWTGAWLVVVTMAVAWLLPQTTLIVALVATAGVLLLLVSAASDLRLVLWLRRLALPDGRWRLQPRDPLRDYSRLPALGRWCPAALCDTVLVREQPGGLGPYRTSSRAEEVMLVPAALEQLARADLVRSSLAVAGGLIALVLLV